MNAYLQYLHAQTLGGGVFSKLGEWLARQKEIPVNGSDGKAFFWVKEHYENADLVSSSFTAFERTQRLVMAAVAEPVALTSFSTKELFEAQQTTVDWLAWPFAAIGLSSILDALPKMGKTRFMHEGIKASRDKKPFLGFPTKPMRVIYVSEQSAASLAMQAHEVGFTGNEPIEELRWITREQWSRHIYEDLLKKLESSIIEGSSYNCLIFDTWHTIARLENENDAAEVNRLGNLTLDLAARKNLALSISRHDRKSGGDVGLSGRSSIQLSGLVDVILHLLRLPGQADPTQRKLQLVGRVPNLPFEQVIELGKEGYTNHGDIKGGVETKKTTDVILERAPNQKRLALPIKEILNGSGINYDKKRQPVRDAVEKLLSDGRLQSRTIKRGKASQTVYWTGELVLQDEF